jgi:hypothetical protein
MKMTRPMRLCLALCAVALALGASQAAAIEQVAFRPGGEITMSGPLTLTSGMTSVRCNVTLTGTLTRTLVAARAESTLGSITAARTAECTNGRLTFLIPASINFARWLILLGTERIIGLLVWLRNFGILKEETFSRCLFGPRVELLIGIERINEPEPYYTLEVTPLNRSIIELFRALSLGCPAEGASLSGTMRLVPTQTLVLL